MSIYGWQRFLSIEEDFLKARNYIEFNKDNENVYSEFFNKSVILLGAEIEACMKELCSEISKPQKSKAGNIGEYKLIILSFYPSITKLKVRLRDTDIEYVPFENWDNQQLPWWVYYNSIKHNTIDKKADMKTAFTMLSAQYLLLFAIDTTKRVREEAYKNSKEKAPICLYFDNSKLLTSPDIDVRTIATLGGCDIHIYYTPKILEEKLK